ncbi:MAG: DUF2961 domain-containing protein [Candidatus Abyssobacteria bacterium SURF_5]|uniref:DUF2961 domain-containing protein n=1 Tax=Abyssobacteria bacterium (strain SURF_5) TaxID=2093360 RepID=A0A3A4NNK9_ABYX5|nr:MAG: DUF2961 domain-containing protein [Candidatus Abyssubacteria bacterium SURF_5]
MLSTISLAHLASLRNCRSLRASSYDRTGGNADFWIFQPGESRVLAHLPGPGIIRHIWMTLACSEDAYLRKIVLKMFWDGEREPSVEVPVGDVFGLGHARTTYFTSLPLSMFDRGFNCFFSMPFYRDARIEVVSECDELPLILYFYIDYEAHERLPEGLGTFHCQWRRKNGCRPVQLPNDQNVDGKENYIVLEASGHGHYVGCHLDIDARTPGWWGEGDDMFFIDGEKWPPAIHGTGTEDYFCGAWNYNEVRQPFCTPYYGYHLKGNDDYTGKHSMYRFHIEDPIVFSRSILFSIEHGHANDMGHDYSSTAYWYQAEPHRKAVDLLPVAERLPRPD